LLAVDGLLGGDLVRRLEQWLADARTDDAVAARARTRWLAAQADEAATFAGVLADLAEHRSGVIVTVAGGRHVRGTVVALGRDFVVTDPGNGAHVIVATGWVSSVRPEPGGAAPSGDRELVLDAELADAVSAVAAERPRIVVTTGSGETVAGLLHAVGRDVVTMRLDGDPEPTVYVRMAALATLALA
jgi:hypothetical protein